MLVPPKRVHSEDRVLNQVQDGLITFARDVAKYAPIDSVRLLSVRVGTGDTDVAHGLARLPQGWMVTDITTAATVHRTGWDSRFITLRASATATVDLLIF